MLRKLATTLVLSGGCLLAQQVRVFDSIDLNNGVYSLDTAGWALNPSPFSLAIFENEDVEITGSLDTTGAFPVLTPHTIVLASDVFELSGGEGQSIGAALDITLESPTATFTFVLAGEAGAPVPLDPFNHPLYTGTTFLQSGSVLLSSGLLVNGQFTDAVPIPNNTALVGLGFRLQGGMVDSQFMLINAKDVVLEL